MLYSIYSVIQFECFIDFICNFIDSPYWMGYPLEAVWFIFDCLAEACITVEDPIMRSPRILPYLDNVMEETHTNILPRYDI